MIHHESVDWIVEHKEYSPEDLIKIANHMVENNWLTIALNAEIDGWGSAWLNVEASRFKTEKEREAYLIKEEKRKTEAKEHELKNLQGLAKKHGFNLTKE